MIAELLRVEGWRVNHKKVERIWREEGLQLPRRHKKRKRLYHKNSSIIRLRPTHPNHVWSIDFVRALRRLLHSAPLTCEVRGHHFTFARRVSTLRSVRSTLIGGGDDSVGTADLGSDL